MDAPISRDSIPAQLLTAKRTAAAQFLRAGPRPTVTAFAVSTRPEQNVVGVGIGRKIVQGQPTGTSVIRFYVERKLPATVVPSTFMLPAAIEGVETDVIETGRFRVLPARTPAPRRRLRPVRPGCSVGFQFTGDQAGTVMAGTLGAIVTAGGTTYLLSNNHVLANQNQLPVGSPIFQPGLLDGGNPASDQVAQLARFVPINPAAPNSVDCAIAAVASPGAVDATVLPRVGALRSASPVDAAEGLAVHKTGRTTGYTRGTIFDVSADVNVDYDVGTVTFQNQVLVQGDRGKFSAAGDSGSLIVDRSTNRATALLFAGSPTHTIGNHIADVLAQVGVGLVT